MPTEEVLPSTIPGVLDRAAERYATVEALVDGDLRLNFAELRDAADEAARAFIASGVEKGDRIGIWAPNIAEWVITALGAHRAGPAGQRRRPLVRDRRGRPGQLVAAVERVARPVRRYPDQRPQEARERGIRPDRGRTGRLEDDVTVGDGGFLSATTARPCDRWVT